jgi:hypothetical protein
MIVAGQRQGNHHKQARILLEGICEICELHFRLARLFYGGTADGGDRDLKLDNR